MPTICYVDRRFSAESLAAIAKANEIIAEYEAQRFSLTLRQLYYQFVSRDLIANRDAEYKRLGSVINDARLAGLIDWKAIEDRTRFVRQNSHWGTPAEIIDSAARSFALDKWDGQPHRPEVWIEKDALLGVIEPVCRRLDVAYFSCRGYTSQSEMWEAAQRLARHIDAGQSPVILHFGDHDPSGKDMSRDIEDRLRLFLSHDLGEADFEFRRLALNMDQIEEFDPPPNPAKLTDSRCRAYIAEFGDESWELDALEPRVIAGLIEGAVSEFRDDDLWDKKVANEDRGRKGLELAAEKWPRVEKFLGNGKSK